METAHRRGGSLKVINSFSGDYDFLSNFYEAPVTFNNILYGSSEAAFQAQKTTQWDQQVLISRMSPGQAKRAGRKLKLREDWESVKVMTMREVCEAKFAQNPELIERLLDTDDAYLEEGNTWGDKFWGVCDGEGENMLGKILMDIREELKIIG